MPRVILAGLLILSAQGALLHAQTAPKQAVVETSAGAFIIDITPETAPNQSAYFMKLAAEGAYDGTTFHRMVKYGLVQGGDPLSKDPSKKSAYGTGGLNVIKAETRAPKMTRGSVAAVLIPGRQDSAGAQFFIVLADQPALGGQYTVFGQVSDGMEVLARISETTVDASGVAVDRLEITKVTIRDTPPVRFVNDSPQDLGQYRIVLDTSAGAIGLEFMPDKAPETVRQFLRLVEAGVYSGTSFHRVAPGFVIQTGALNTRTAPLTEKQQQLVHNLPPEFNDTKHVKGIVSMARGDDPGSASTSFFICTGTSQALDGVYTAFARVTDGMSVVEAIESTPRTGEAPNTRIDLKGIRIEKR
jgi:peptidyl-prolyl cis-trans isomerase B (cyclophilin B)